MAENPLAQAGRLIEQAAALLDSSTDPLAALLVAEGGSRLMDRVKVSQIAAVDRDGSPTEKGYKTALAGVKDLLGWDHDIARRHVTVAQHAVRAPRWMVPRWSRCCRRPRLRSPPAPRRCATWRSSRR
jgi:5-methylcytosine-specific restriction protein A